MITIERTDSSNKDFRFLTGELDSFLWKTYGQEHTSYFPLNRIENLDTVVVAYENGKPVGCGCFKIFDDHTVEIKRMFVMPEERNKGIAAAVLEELERWAKESEYSDVVLETGTILTSAMNLYKKHHYQVIENWGPYAGNDSSTCMKKSLLED